MRLITIFFGGMIFFFPFFAFANVFIDTKVGDVRMKLIQYNLENENYELRVGVSDEEADLEQLMLNNNGVSAVNGVFFCPKDYSKCQDYTFTINERYVEGKKIGFYDDTGERVVYGWNKDMFPFLFQTNKINGDKEVEIYEGFANFPLLLNNGINQLEHYYDVGLIDYKMKASATRNFICNDKEKKNIYFGLVYDVTLDELVQVLSQFGCSDALNLDAGKSTAFIYNGRYLVGPQRPILDGLIIVKKGFDVKTLDTDAKILSEKILHIISPGKTLMRRINILNQLDTRLTEIRGEIYDKNSVDLFDENQQEIGYKIDVQDTKTLKKIYTINSLQKYIKEIIKNMQSEIEAENLQ